MKERESNGCYWTNICNGSCKMDEYVMGESTLLSDGSYCMKNGKSRYCCGGAGTLPASDWEPASASQPGVDQELSSLNDKWEPAVGVGPVCDVPGGISCAALRGQLPPQTTLPTAKNSTNNDDTTIS